MVYASLLPPRKEKDEFLQITQAKAILRDTFGYERFR